MAGGEWESGFIGVRGVDGDAEDGEECRRRARRAAVCAHLLGERGGACLVVDFGVVVGGADIWVQAGIHLCDNDTEAGVTPTKLYGMLTDIYEYV